MRLVLLLLFAAAVVPVASCTKNSAAQRTIPEHAGTIRGLSEEALPPFDVERGERLQFVLGQSGLDLFLELAIDGEALGRFDSATGRFGEERVLLEVPKSGSLTVTVGAVRLPEVSGTYRLKVVADVPEDAAESLFTAASRVDQPLGPRQRVEGFEAAARQFARQQRLREEGLASFAAMTLLNLTASSSTQAVENGARAVTALAAAPDANLQAAAHNALAAAYGEARQKAAMEKDAAEATRLQQAMAWNFAEARRLYGIGGSEVGAVEVDLYEAALADEGRYSEALLKIYLDSVRRCAALGEQVCEAFAFMDVAMQVRNRGDFPLAFDYLYQALKLVDPVADSGTVAEIHDNLASTLRMVGDFDAAIFHHQRALNAFGQFGECSGLSRSYYGIGYALLGIGDDEQALRYYKLALDRSCTTGNPAPEEPQSVAVAPSASQLCELAASFASLDKDDRAIASWTTWDLGNLARSMSDAKVALQCHEIANRLATIDRHVLGTQLEQVRDKIDLGEATAANAIFSAIDLKIVQENPWYRAQRSEVAAQLDAALGRTRAGITGYASAAKEYEAVGNFEGVFSALSRRAALASATGDPQAFEYFANAEAALENVRLLSLDPVFSATLFASGRRIYEDWITALLTQQRKVQSSDLPLHSLAISERSRARLLAQVAAAAQIGQQARDAQLRSIAGTTVAVIDAAERGELPPAAPQGTAVPSTWERVNTMLGLDKGRLDVRNVSGAIASIEAYRKTLSSQTVVIEYLLGERHSRAWVLGKNFVYQADLGAAAPIQNAVDKLNVALGGKKDAAETKLALARLHDLVWKPLKLPAGISTIELVPDDVLHEVPFAALWDSERNQYLVEQATFFTLPSIHFAATRAAGPAAMESGEGVLLVGDPVYEFEDARDRCATGAQNSQASMMPVKLRRIPASGTEVGKIDKVFRDRKVPVSLLVGCSATRQRVLEAQPARYRFVHFATHATSDRVLPQRSSIFLSGWNEDGSASPAVLSAADILEHPLRADLVVLSGCATGGGRQIGGEGSLGLTFSLIAGGSRAAISTLWSVTDAASVVAMTRLYDGMISHDESAAQALQRAQLEMLKSKRWSHPRHWAPYSLLGT